MKNLILILFLLSMGMASKSQVQRQQAMIDKNKMEHQKHKDALKALDLNDTQKEQIRQINQNLKNRRLAIIGDSTLTQTDRRAKMMELSAERRNSILKILTDEQKQKLILTDPVYNDMVPMPRHEAAISLDKEYLI